MTFDFTAFPSRIVEILLDALHFDVVVISKENRKFTILFELIIFLLDDGKLRYFFGLRIHTLWTITGSQLFETQHKILSFDSRIEQDLLDVAILHLTTIAENLSNEAEVCFSTMFLTKLAKMYQNAKSQLTARIDGYKTTWFKSTLKSCLFILKPELVFEF